MFKSKALRVYVGGTTAALAIALFSLIAMNQEQCPAGYTQAQIDASDCIIGANIGRGITLLVAVVVEIISLVAAAIIAVRGHSGNRRG